MSDNPSEEEPSIEEILASIRQIISDDDDEEKEEEPAEEIMADILETQDEEKEEVLELTEKDMEEPPAPAPEPEPEPEIEMVEATPEPEPEIEEEPEEVFEVESPIPSDIMSSATQKAAVGSIAKLASKMPINNSRSYSGVTLEDLVKEMLHPMLREWMDGNLPPMVERIVQKELEKLARRAADD